MNSRTNQILPVAVASLVLAAGQAVGMPQQEQAQPAQPQQRAPQNQAQQQDDPQAEQEAKRILDRVRQHYADVQGVTVKVDMSTTMQMQGEEIKQEQPTLEVAAERPNKAALRVSQNGEQYALISDGDTMWHYMGDVLDAYTEEPAPQSFGDIINAASFGQQQDSSSLLMMPHIIVLALMDGEQFNQLIDGAQSVRSMGQEEVDGKTYDRLRIETDTIDADMWVRSGEEAWVDRIQPDMSKMFEGMQGMEGAEDFAPPKFEVAFREWTEQEQVAEDAFAFDPPDDAKKVASLMEAMQEQMGQDMGMGDQAQNDLLGKPAPDVELQLLSGGTMSLAKHKQNKEIVVLDFWATWCPPCVRGLPLVSGVAKEFADKGVVFYAVNVREQPETIKAFLEKNKLDIKVPLDSDGKAGEAYGVTGIPQTVIIGKDGTVQAVHVGFAPGSENQLRDELGKLTAGESLVAAPKEVDG